MKDRQVGSLDKISERKALSDSALKMHNTGALPILFRQEIRNRSGLIYRADIQVSGRCYRAEKEPKRACLSRGNAHLK